MSDFISSTLCKSKLTAAAESSSNDNPLFFVALRIELLICKSGIELFFDKLEKNIQSSFGIVEFTVLLDERIEKSLCV